MNQLEILIIGIITGFIFALALMGIYPPVAHAQTATVSLTVPCSNYNMDYSPRCTAPPKSFTVSPLGEITGELESGVKFKQTRITANMMLFEAEEMRWIVYKNKIVMI